ncbi:FecCD family ABC transporter permease [Arsenophonus endosymbiont of Apis mellifera]|uniref:FecCD family ABC transporter permease n=1 Tax=Arsenophonus endosymbiont of Apis mellifera TaxID=1541805 RepID=UPI0015D801C6|nr:iron chelate uptake ABC transporter family permease subunit [Arsenophonus endosymbiont of Apis mellifera]
MIQIDFSTKQVSTKTFGLANIRFITPSRQTSSRILFLLLLLVLFLYLTLAFGREGMDNPWLEMKTRYQQFILLQIRLPRALVAIGAGMTLALSGALFQITTRNALASPDIIGINAGAAVGIMAVLLLWPDVVPVSVGALSGAIIAVFLVYLANGAVSGEIQTVKIVLSGIAVAALCMALVDFAISNTRIEQAQQIRSLLSGSLANRGWQDVVLISGMLVFIPILFWLGKQLNYISLGNDIAITLGVPVRLVQIISILVAIIFATLSVLVVGPVAFVALAAPQIARRIILHKGVALFCSMLVGALLMLSADFITLILPTPGRLTVGLVTSAIGGTYLMYLLYMEFRRIS